MPKPKRCRRVCSEPRYAQFMPINHNKETIESIILTIDEYEVIRLVDYENKSHVDCAKIMDISRTTATEIYQTARKKISDCLVNGKALVIKGGEYRFCDGSAYPHCHKKCNKYTNSKEIVIKKGDNIMRIAVTFDCGEVFQHFGHTEQFKFYDVEDNKIVSTHILDTNGNGHGALAGFLQVNQVDVVICGGIGSGAQNALAQAGIQLYGGVSGNVDEVVDAFIAGKLGYNPDIKCSHHEHDEGHACGEHGCGSHNCGH